MTNVSNEPMPSAVLRDEHQSILRVITVLERLVQRSEAGEGFEADPLGKCVEFFQLFADACHHAKEEDLLFPVLESRGIPREGGPIGVMLQEHTVARGHVKTMAEALAAREVDASQAAARFGGAAKQYIDLLRQHIDKEDDVLYVMGDSVMTDEDQRSLCGKFCEVGCRSFGGKKREQLQAIAEELEAQWSGV